MSIMKNSVRTLLAAAVLLSAFALDSHAQCATTGTKLLEPRQDSRPAAGAITFSWAAMTDAASYDLLLTPDGGRTTTFNTTSTSHVEKLGVGKFSWLVRTNFINLRCPPQDSATFTFTACPAITVGPPALPGGTVGVAYKQALAASGGAAPHTFALGGGTVLPDGLLLATDGTISGTPRTAGSFKFIITATDANGCFGSSTITLDICPAITVGPPALPRGTVGVSYKEALSASGSAGPHTFALGGGTVLPDGLLLSTDGTISGTPKTAGSFSFIVTATDTNTACSGSSTIRIDICPAITVGPPALPGGTVGVGYKQALAASGGAAPHTFALDGGTVLPDGLLLATDGTISGTPKTAGSFKFIVTATDANRCSGSSTITLDIAPPRCPTITVGPLTLPAGTAGVGYKQALTASGGAAPHTFALDGGTVLPDGLLLATDGTISGTPKTAGSFKFIITATDANRCSGSSTISLEIAAPCPTGIATVLGPAAGATFDGTRPIAFSWTAVSGSVSYDVLVSKDGGATFSIAASTSETNASASLSAGEYVWTVRSNFGPACRSTVSSPSKFSVVAATSCPTAMAVLVSPADGATGLGTIVVFEWRAVPGAIGYTLLLSIDGAPPAKVASTTNTTVKIEVPQGAISWSVLTSFADCPATVSASFRFSTAKSTLCPSNPPAPSLEIPPDGATGLNSPVTFSWSLVSGASGYRVLASVNGGSTAVLTTTTATRHEATFASGSSVVWQVEALFEGCASTFSARRTFTVSAGTTCSTTAPTLISPANGASAVLSPVTFTWNAAKGAVAYILYLSIDGSAFEAAAKTTGTTHTQILNAPAKVAWQVEALFLGCDPARSSVSSFVLIEAKTCPAGSITLNAPAANAIVTSPVTFSWSGISGATDYRVWASIDGATPSVVAKSTSTTATAAITSGAVKWSVEALFGPDCRSIISPDGAFTVQAADTCGSNRPPALVSPVGSESAPVDVNPSVELRWSPAPGAIGYRVWRSFNGSAPEDFAETKETAVTMTGDPGVYAWFVEAVFAGCRPLLSTRGFFRIAQTEPRCSTDAPSLITPVDGATGLSSAITFLWSEVSEAAGYRVYASFESEGKITDFILIGETRETSLARAIPPSRVTWFVEAVFKACPSTNSARFRFTIPESTNCRDEKPELITPPDGAQDMKSPVELSWSPVTGAVKYVVVAKTATGEPAPVGETTAETALTRHMPAGATIEWWVIAFRGGCSPVESNHRTFSVELPPSCDARPPVLQAPPERALVTNPVQLSWTAVAGASAYRVWAVLGNDRPVLIANPTRTEVVATLPTGRVEWYVEATFDLCPPVRSGAGVFDVMAPAAVCHAPERPAISVIGQALADTPYGVRWAPIAAVTGYELQESDSRSDFSAAATHLVLDATYRTFVYPATEPIQKFYRVRGISACSDDRGRFSDVVGVHIVPVNAIEQRLPGTAEIGVQQSVVQTMFVRGSATPVPFTARMDRSWLHVSPESGVLGPDGMTFTITAEPGTLSLGANTGTLLLTYGAAGKGAKGGAQTTNVPVSISLVTPVSPTGKNTPPAEALIIPAVGHSPGANNSLFQSDVRLANTSTQSVTYQLNFTPTGSDGTVSGSSTTIQIQPGGTAALNDILASFFGTGPGGAALGVLEVRPLTTSTTSSSLTSSLATATIASSRTYNVTESGTLGQYIPAVPFSRFIGKSPSSVPSVLSMQQIAQNTLYRTNLGLVEGSGQPAVVMIRVFDAAGRPLAEVPETLKAFEHKQLNAFLANAGLQLDDGRIEVEVTSATGKVTAYASMVDNKTNDPLLVQPVVKSAVHGTRYVVPGVAYIDGLAKWRSDVRVFNAGTATTTAKITYFPQGNTAGAMTKEVTLAGGQVLAFDNVLHNFFGINESNAGGSLLISTTSSSSLVATARTYAETDNGTFGLFAPGVTPEESIGIGEKSAHLLQLENSSEYRTNIGLVETSGNAASVEVSLVLPDSKVTPKLKIDLAANGFLQFPLSGFGVGSAVYNARIAVKVISGSGRVSAYGSVIDNRTNDSTYVPSQ